MHIILFFYYYIFYCIKYLFGVKQIISIWFTAINISTVINTDVVMMGKSY